MSYKIENVIKNYKNKLKKGITEYIALLKVIGNNYKYPYDAQLNIYSVNPKAKACAEYDFWKNNFNRPVKRREKGIPIYTTDKNGKRKVKYIFDISQTVKKIRSSELNLWKFEKENYKEIFNLTKEDFFEAKKDYIKSYCGDIKIDSNKIENFDSFIEKSIIISVNERLGIREEIFFDDKAKNIYKNMDEKIFSKVIENISKVSNNILKEIEKNIKEKTLEKISNVRYYDDEKRHSQNKEMEMIGHENRDNKRQRISSGERYIYSSSERDAFRTGGREIQNRTDRWRTRDTGTIHKRENDIGGSIGRRRSESLGENEDKLFGKRERRTVEGITGNGENNGLSDGISGQSRPIYRERKTENDDILGINGRTERKRSTKIQRTNEQLGLFDTRNDNVSIDTELKNKINDINEKNSQTTFSNFIIEKEPEKLTPSERLKNNIEAIKVLKKLGYNHATKEEQKILSKYVGWGGLSEVFDENKKGQWEATRIFLKENLTEREYSEARISTLTSFYTPKTIINSIYQVLDNLGFEEGNILEPSCGVGNFIGSIPEKFSDSKVYGVEIDEISGSITKKLYPDANIQIKGFEEVPFSDNSFDVAIGNVPFGEYKILDRIYGNNFFIHDYFFVKTLDKVKEGGIIAFITSSGTLDKKDDSIRKYIGSNSEFLGAVRLPNNIFKGVAGTEVVSDIIFLKKTAHREKENENWYKVSTDSKGMTYNSYFVDNPEMILGKMEEVSGRFGKKLTCVPKENFEENLKIAINKIKGEYNKERVPKDIEVIQDKFSVEVKNFSYIKKDNKIYFKENEKLIEKNFSEKDIIKIIKYIELSNSLRRVINIQKDNGTDKELVEEQNKLNRLYDEFKLKYGHINSISNSRLFRDDSNYPLLSSIEELDEKNNFVSKRDIFYKRTIKQSKPIEKVDTAEEALILSITQKGKVDLTYMETVTGKIRKELITELKNRIYFEPKKQYYVTDDEYLSGNIREKIKELDYYIDNLPIYNKISLEDLNFQREKLIEAIPKELGAGEINVRIGATWIPDQYIKQFIGETLKTPSYRLFDINVRYSEYTSEWKIENKRLDSDNPLANMTFGTNRANAYRLIEEE